jgi:hypothetical protein
VTNKPIVSGSRIAHSRNPSMIGRAGGRPDAHRDQRLHRAPDGLQVDRRVITADHTLFAQRTHPFQRGGGRDTDLGSEVAVGLPGVALQLAQQRLVGRIHAHPGHDIPDNVRAPISGFTGEKTLMHTTPISVTLVK